MIRLYKNKKKFSKRNQSGMYDLSFVRQSRAYPKKNKGKFLTNFKGSCM